MLVVAGQAAVAGTPFGRYRLAELLSRGGMGEVRRAHDTETDRVVAIKLLPAHFSDNEEFQRRFRREAHAAARLNTPHVIPIHNYGEIDGRLYVDMRLIEGGDLEAVLAEGPIAPTRAVRIIEGVAEALQAAHKVGLVHRDVKPSNILLDENDFAYLIDFGIARAAAETRLTNTGNMIGTFLYMAPERLGGGQEDARADIYALACVLYKCLTGQPPFAGDSVERLVMAHLNRPPPKPSSTQPSVPAQFDTVIATGMAKDPEKRYATTVELAEAARDAITVPIQRPAPSPPTEQEGPVTAPWAPHGTPPQPPPGAFASAATQHPAEPVPTHMPGSGSAATQDHRTASAAPPAGSPPTPVDASLNQRRKRRTKIALITGGVVIIAIAAVVLDVLLWTGSLSKTAGPSSPSLSTPPPKAAGALDALLLSTDQINTAMGTKGMTVDKSYTTMTDATADISDKDCLAVAFPAQFPVYAGSGWTAVRKQDLREPGDKPTGWAEQAVVLFPAATDAAAFFTDSATKWQACANHKYTYAAKGQYPSTWTVGAVSNTNATLSVRQTQEGNTGWNCQNALTVRNNVAVDVEVCSYSEGDIGINIAHQIADKVPKQ